MAQKNRSKEIWLVPKRVSLHQTICLIDGIIERKYDGTSWNPQKQNNLGVNLKNWGATKSGKNISAQAIRTLLASIPQYLGFVYINTDTTPNTICLTEAGMALWHKHKNELVHIPNLAEGKDNILRESEVVLQQLEKLQVTNPVISKDCENIYVFPFRFMLQVLQKIRYLDQEEIAYFLFKVRNEDEVNVIAQDILNFRTLPMENREALINEFKKTHIGNITLVKASSAGYFASLCVISGIIEKKQVKPCNCRHKVSALQIKEEYSEYVSDIFTNRYKNAEVFDFENNLQLWIDYIGNPDRCFPPISVSITNGLGIDVLIQIKKKGTVKYDELLKKETIISYPMFVGEEYSVVILSAENGSEISNMPVIPDFEKREFELKGTIDEVVVTLNETVEEIANEIIEHCDAQNFSSNTLNYLNTIKKVTGIDKTTDKSLRGAYLEYLFYKLLTLLEKDNIIDATVWNGKIGRYGLPTAAPGGVTGTPDIIFMIDDMHIVLEVTTIKPKAIQFSAEGASVPDHIRLYKESVSNEVIGIFCAPIMHSRNIASLQSTIFEYGIKLKCITEKELLDALIKKDRNKLVDYLRK
ncbi:MAG: AlwI family type II restriction endonuclease [Mobilitalea sp.]